MTLIMGTFDQVIICSSAAPVPPSDPDDEIFLLCAMDGNADYLVAEDHHLTDLRTHYTKPVIGRSADLARHFGV